jgi:outer membrane receptor for ferrienterochelin and colicins
VSGSLFETPGPSPLYFPEFDTPETNHGLAEHLDGDRYVHTFGDLQYGNLRVQGLYASRLKGIPTASYGTNFNDPANRTTDSRGYLDVSYRRSLGRATDVDLRGYYDAYRFLGGYAYGGTDSPDRSVQINDAAADWAGFEAVVAHKFGRHRVVGGASAEYNFRVNQKNYYLGESPFLDSRESPALAASFGEVELNLTPKVTVNAGGRLDWYNEFGVALSPRIAFIYLPAPRTTVKYIFGRAFRAPDAYDLFYVDQIDVTAVSKGLKPEDVTSHTLVLEHSLTPWLALTVDGFYNNLERVIEEKFDPETGLTHFANSEGDRGRGIEFELDAKRASGWAARASYTFAETQEDFSREATANSPSHLAKLHATIPVARRAFLGVELLYTGAQENYARIHIPPSFLTNVTLSSKPLWGGWQFAASFYNLFDRSWATPTGPDLTPAAVVQDGRTFRFTISRKLNLLPQRSKK